jgi:hypothetical protein
MVRDRLADYIAGGIRRDTLEDWLTAMLVDPGNYPTAVVLARGIQIYLDECTAGYCSEEELIVELRSVLEQFSCGSHMMVGTETSMSTLERSFATPHLSYQFLLAG